MNAIEKLEQHRFLSVATGRFIASQNHDILLDEVEYYTTMKMRRIGTENENWADLTFLYSSRDSEVFAAVLHVVSVELPETHDRVVLLTSPEAEFSGLLLEWRPSHNTYNAVAPGRPLASTFDQFKELIIDRWF